MLEAGIVVDESKIKLEGDFIIADMEEGCTSGVFDDKIIEVVGRTVDDVRYGIVWRASELDREGVAELIRNVEFGSSPDPASVYKTTKTHSRIIRDYSSTLCTGFAMVIYHYSCIFIQTEIFHLHFQIPLCVTYTKVIFTHIAISSSSTIYCTVDHGELRYCSDFHLNCHQSSKQHQ